MTEENPPSVTEVDEEGEIAIPLARRLALGWKEGDPIRFFSGHSTRVLASYGAPVLAA